MKGSSDNIDAMLESLDSEPELADTKVDSDEGEKKA